VKAILVTCPHCGARVQVTGTSDTVRCEYCGTVALVQRRTRVLERVLPPPPRPPDKKPMPVAVQRRTGMSFVALFGALLPMLIGAGVTLYTSREAQRAVQAIPGIGPALVPADAPEWQGTDAVIVLANGDIVGRSRRVRQRDEVRVMRIDGATGKLRWESPPLGTYSDTYQGKLAVSDPELVLFASSRAELRAFALASGKELWKAQLPERVAQLCQTHPDVIDVVTTDGVQHPLLRATGKPAGALGSIVEEAPKKKPAKKEKRACARLPDDSSASDRPTPSTYDLGRRVGLSVDRVLALPDGRLVSGTRDKGTRVPTLVAVDARSKQRWRAEVPTDPLGAQERAAEDVAVGPSQVCAAYHAESITTPKHITCFALSDGHRLWDAVGGNSVNLLQVTPGGLLVGSYGALELRELATGAVRWTLGR
jgi:outer membrane protein assembly factor BamB/DNA-directed RNA polymerase subunit RPC12/RpoP